MNGMRSDRRLNEALERPAGEPDRRLSVAPMMDWTDRHDRYFLRQITRRTLLYSEMVTSAAVVHGDRHRLIGFDPAEHPLALQLGGSEPEELAEAARIAEDFGYDEINLNVGCPSDRVQKGRFGACLMAEPDLVARCVAAMNAAVSIPVTVKSRIGIDERDDYAFLRDFVERVADAGCRSFAVHARKAILEGLSPKENREIPPLVYDRVYRLKEERADLEIVLNGGVQDLAAAAAHLERVDGVMIGRAAYQTPYLLATADRQIFGDVSAPAPTRESIVEAMVRYAERQCHEGTPIKSITRHILGLFHGEPGARTWRRHLSTAPYLPGAGAEVIAEALASMRDSAEAA